MADSPESHAQNQDHLRQETLYLVRALLADVLGPENMLGLAVGWDTSFDVDLQMESLEFVTLIERLAQHHGDTVDFVAWLAALEMEEIITLTVGDLVSFVVSSMAPPHATADQVTRTKAGPVT